MSANEQLNQALRQEISAITPNRIDDLLAQLGEQQSPLPQQQTPTAVRRPKPLRRQLVAAVLALIVVGGGIFYGAKSAQRSVVIVDADAPVAFTVDGFDRVRSVRLEDTRAATVVDASQCNGKKLDAAVQNLTEQYIEHNVLSADENAVLVSVQEDGAKRAESLAQKTKTALSEAAASHEITPAVVMQTITEDAASVNGASPGKTAFVDKLVGGIEEKETADLTRAALQDLLYFSEEKALNPERLTMVGDINESIYHTADGAIEIACADAGYDAASIQTSALLGWNDTDLVYMATLDAGDRVGYYCISARTGEILDVYWVELKAQIDEGVPVPGTSYSLPSIPGTITPGLPVQPGPPTLPSSDFDYGSIVQFFELWDDII